MQKNVFERHKYITGIIVALVLSTLFLIIAEFAIRRFMPQVCFVGQTGDILVKHKYGTAFGYKPFAEGVAWGAKVYTDEYGFRTYPGMPSGSYPLTIAIVGDSVPFGTGVKAENSFPSLLSQTVKENVLNLGVIGYHISSYKEIINYFILEKQHELKIQHVLLFLTLNDIFDSSATSILQHFEKDSSSESAHVPRYKGITGFFVKLTKRINFNYYLISRSKLYLVVKGLLHDSSKTWFLGDYTAYHNEQLVEHFKEEIMNIKTSLQDSGINLIVFIIPYEYQLRTDDSTLRLPQRILTEFLYKEHIKYSNFYEGFQQFIKTHDISVKQLYKFNDHCHLSKIGHELVAKLMLSVLKEHGIVPFPIFNPQNNMENGEN